MVALRSNVQYPLNMESHHSTVEESPYRLFEATELLSCRLVRDKDGESKYLYGNYDVSNAWKDIVPQGWEMMAQVPAYGDFWHDLLANNFPENVPDGPFLIQLTVEYRSAHGTDEEILEVLMELNETAKQIKKTEDWQDVLKEVNEGKKFFGRVTSNDRGESTLVRWFVVKDLKIREFEIL